MNQDEYQKLCRILGMLGSSFDGERAAAAIKATEFIQSRGLQWSDVIAPITVRPQPEPRPAPSPQPEPTLKRHVVVCRKLLSEYANHLTEWEQQFCEDMLAWRKEPTGRQKAVVNRIIAKVRAARR